MKDKIKSFIERYISLPALAKEAEQFCIFVSIGGGVALIFKKDHFDLQTILWTLVAFFVATKMREFIEGGE